MTNLPETNISLLFAIFVLTQEMEIYKRMLAHILIFVWGGEGGLLTDQGLAVVMTTRAIRIDFLAPLVEPYLENIDRSVIQDAGRGFDNNMRSGRIVFHIDDVRVVLAPFEVFMVTDAELRDGNTTLEFVLEIVHSVRIQVIDGADFGPLQEFGEMLLGSRVHDGW